MYNETNHSERQHATYSPSKLKALEICPRFQQDNDAPPHPITLRGTAMHEAVEAGTPEIEGLSDYEKEMVRYLSMHPVCTWKVIFLEISCYDLRTHRSVKR